jgi:hypothetical protein
VELAHKAARELVTVPGYAEQFGKGAPNPALAAGTLTTARGWSDELALAEDWYKYVRYQAYLAWKQNRDVLSPLQEQFQATRARDPSLAERYPSLSSYFDVRSAEAVRRGKKRVATPAQPAVPAPTKPVT